MLTAVSTERAQYAQLGALNVYPTPGTFQRIHVACNYNILLVQQMIARPQVRSLYRPVFKDSPKPSRGNL